MFKVQCPDCDAPYQVDERRVPPDGIKMRCPKCGGSFHVARPQALGGAAPVPVSSIPAPILARGTENARPPAPMRRAHQATMLGVAPSKVPPVVEPLLTPQPGAGTEATSEPAKPPETLRVSFGSGSATARGAMTKPEILAGRGSSVPGRREELDIDVDLPVPRPAGAPRPAAQPGESSAGDLSVPKQFSRAKFPSAFEIEDDVSDSNPVADARAAAVVFNQAPPEPAEVELDLPSLGERIHGVSNASEQKQENVDLPEVLARGGAGGSVTKGALHEAGTSAPKVPTKEAPRPRIPRLSGSDLPVVSLAGPSGRDDLPLVSPAGAPGRDGLPAVSRGSASARNDLPAVSRGGAPGRGDLPAVSHGGAPGRGDLPAVSRGGAPGRGDLPAVSRGGAPGRGDLPAMSRGGAPGRGDLPSVASGVASLPQPAQRAQGGIPGRTKKKEAAVTLPSAGSPELELEVPSVASRSGLPAVPSARVPSLKSPESSKVAALEVLPDLDLPSPGEALDIEADGAEWELPSPAGALSSSVAAGLPLVAGGDMPAVSGVGLPATAADLPALASELPSVVPADLPDNVAGLPGIGTDMPMVPRGTAQIRMFESDVAPGRAPRQTQTDLSAAAWSDVPGADASDGHGEEWGDGAAFGEVNITSASDSGSGDMTFDASLRAGAPEASVIVRDAGGGTAFGEVNLGGETEAEEVVDLRSAPPAAADEDMEFGAIPQVPPRVAPRTDEAPTESLPEPTKRVLPALEQARRERRRWLVAGGVVGVVVIGGAALSLVPELGPFGAHYIVDTMNREEYQRILEREVQAARTALKNDTYLDYEKAMRALETAIARNERLPSLVVYAAFLGELSQLRFGPVPQQKARADVRLSQFVDRDDPYLATARAALAASDGEFARARKGLARRGGTASDRLDMAVLSGEIELAAGNAKSAIRSWEAAEAIEKSARTAYGMARSMVLSGDLHGARRGAELSVKRNPTHLGARILLALAFWQLDRDLTAALEQVESVTRDSAKASPDEQVQALTLLGNIHLEMSHISAAETAYAGALKIRPQSGNALAGLGDALYRAGRYSEALARFEAAVQANPNDVVAAVGAAKTKIALEKLRDASAMLKKLREVHPASALVHYWCGRADEGLGNRDEAEKAYRSAMASADKSRAVVEAYVALALLMNQQGRRDEAQSVLLDAREKLGDSAEVHRALGQLSFSQGRYDDALSRFRAAERLDSRDLATKFHIGATLSRQRNFDGATKAFDEVAAVDRDFPGLALERGLLFETSGRGEEALKMYESALAKAPNDPDLMLRVGCGNVLAGRFAPAIGLLNKVLIQKPQSAETNHCLGRAMLLEGKNLAEALRYLNRAVELDPHRSEYYLYVGWAANEAGRVSEAEKALKRALELDQGLADAYWQRGVLRYRQGAVKDALADLVKALDLRPSRAEARASLADTYYDLGREAASLDQWKLAIEAQPENATWRFRYGRLLAQNRSSAEARSELRKALELAEGVDPKPRWVWEAHRLLARAIGRQSEAVQHWESFLRLAPQDNVYRDEAKAELRQLGKPWDGL